MAHHRDLGVEDRVHRVDALAPTFELHRRRSGAHEPRGVGDGLLAREVVAHPRQVGDDERARLRARDRTGVVRHVVDRDVQRVVVAEHDHRDRVAHEDHVDARGVDRSCRGCVVRGDHHQRCAGALARDDIGRAERASGSLTRVGHRLSSTVQGTHGSRRRQDSTSTSAVGSVLAASMVRSPARLRATASIPAAPTVPAPTAPPPQGWARPVPTAVELAPGQEVPPAVGAHLDHVAGELVVRGAEALELARVDDAAPVGLAQVLAVDVRHVAHVAGRAHRALVRAPGSPTWRAARSSSGWASQTSRRATVPRRRSRRRARRASA